jgi:hypothetical protein
VSISARSRTVWGLATRVFDTTSSPRASFIGNPQQSDAEGIERCTRAWGSAPERHPDLPPTGRYTV